MCPSVDGNRHFDCCPEKDHYYNRVQEPCKNNSDAKAQLLNETRSTNLNETFHNSPAGTLVIYEYASIQYNREHNSRNNIIMEDFNGQHNVHFIFNNTKKP